MHPCLESHYYNFNDTHYIQKKATPLTEKQLQLLHKVAKGWKLYKDPNTFKWFLCLVREPPFKHRIRIIYSPTANILEQKRVLIQGKRDSIGIQYHITEKEIP